MSKVVSIRGRKMDAVLTKGRLIGYGRVSTDQQTLEGQEEQLRKAGCELVFVEKVSTRVPDSKRKALMDCLGELKVGDTLVVSKLDRLGRTQVEVVNRINQLTEDGIYLKTLDGLLDTKALGMMAPLLIGVISGLAEVERSLIRERTLESIAYRRRTGGKLGGRPPVPGQKRELVMMLHNGGKTFREIAEALDISKSTAHKIVQEFTAA